MIAKILETNDNAYGYDAQSGEYGDLMSRGIIDPAKVVRSALQGAASVAACSSRPKPWWPRFRARRRPSCPAITTTTIISTWSSERAAPSAAATRTNRLVRPAGP